MKLNELWCHAIIDGEYCGKVLRRRPGGGRPPKYCPEHRGTRPHVRTQAPPRLQLVPRDQGAAPAPSGKVAERVGAELDRVADALEMPHGAPEVLTVLEGTRRRLAELDAAGTPVSPALRALVLKLADGFEHLGVLDPTKLASLSREFRAALVDLEPQRKGEGNGDPFGLAEIFNTEAS